MSLVKVQGNASGTGTLTIAAPNTNSNFTLDIPTASGTLQVSGNPISGTTGTFSGTISGGSTIGVGGATPSNSGAGITFPATQSASTDANTLDDYEEGTWTPVDGSGAGLSFSNTSGNCTYTKIGRTVFASFRVTYPSTANGNAARIGGLPFTSGSNTVNTQPVCFAEQSLSAGAMAVIEQNATTILILTVSGGVVSVNTNANVSTRDFRGMAIYQV